VPELPIIAAVSILVIAVILIVLDQNDRRH